MCRATACPPRDSRSPLLYAAAAAVTLEQATPAKFRGDTLHRQWNDFDGRDTLNLRDQQALDSAI